MAGSKIDGVQQAEGGFSLIEVIVALSLFSVMGVSLAIASGGSFRMIGGANGRQQATQQASRAIEELRATPYEAIGLDPSTVFETDPGSPDAGVLGGTSFKIPLEGGAVEDLVLSGTTEHIEQATTDGFKVRVYRYVTWATAARDHKRVTVVAQWQGEDARTGRKPQVVLSSLFSQGSVGWSSVLAAPTTASTAISLTTTTTLLSTPTTAAPLVPCSDATPPWATLQINAGTGSLTGYTASPTVSLALGGGDDCGPLEAQLSIDLGTTWSAWEPWTPTRLLTTPVVSGDVTVSVRYRDASGKLSARADASVRIDTLAPTTPSSFSVKRRNANKADLSWGASLDNDKLVGYRVYRRVGTSGSSTVITEVPASPGIGTITRCITASCGWTDPSLRSGVAYTYHVVAFDAAGNESAATSMVVV